ncbi:hypothetical protein EON62_00425 [archaeon]|nr:MAG: hypothetical protein EON62_00425 [archaeon]
MSVVQKQLQDGSGLTKELLLQLLVALAVPDPLAMLSTAGTGDASSAAVDAPGVMQLAMSNAQNTPYAPIMTAATSMNAFVERLRQRLHRNSDVRAQSSSAGAGRASMRWRALSSATASGTVSVGGTSSSPRSSAADNVALLMSPGRRGSDARAGVSLPTTSFTFAAAGASSQPASPTTSPVFALASPNGVRASAPRAASVSWAVNTPAAEPGAPSAAPSPPTATRLLSPTSPLASPVGGYAGLHQQSPAFSEAMALAADIGNAALRRSVAPDAASRMTAFQLLQLQQAPKPTLILHHAGIQCMLAFLRRMAGIPLWEWDAMHVQLQLLPHATPVELILQKSYYERVKLAAVSTVTVSAPPIPYNTNLPATVAPYANGVLSNYCTESPATGAAANASAPDGAAMHDGAHDRTLNDAVLRIAPAFNVPSLAPATGDSDAAAFALDATTEEEDELGASLRAERAKQASIEAHLEGAAPARVSKLSARRARLQPDVEARVPARMYSFADAEELRLAERHAAFVAQRDLREEEEISLFQPYAQITNTDATLASWMTSLQRAAASTARGDGDAGGPRAGGDAAQVDASKAPGVASLSAGSSPRVAEEEGRAAQFEKLRSVQEVDDVLQQLDTARPSRVRGDWLREPLVSERHGHRTAMGPFSYTYA